MISFGFSPPPPFQPPKNSYVNYKVLQEQIKEKKAAKEEEKRTVRVRALLLLWLAAVECQTCCLGSSVDRSKMQSDTIVLSTCSDQLHSVTLAREAGIFT